MLEHLRARQHFIRRRLAVPRAAAAALAAAFIAAQVVGGWLVGGSPPRAAASPSISQIYFTPYEAQQYIGVLRGIAGDPGCCSGPVISTISITSGAAGNTVVYDHFEDGYEVDPYNPVQASTVALTLDDGDVWTRTSNVPVDQPGRGAGTFFDGRDRIVSSAPIAVTQTAYANTPGSLHAGAVEVLDLDKSGTAFDIPVGQNADYNGVFEYVGLVVVGNQRGTAVQIDADADGSFETPFTLDEGETHLVAGGVNLGARVRADRPVAVYVITGDVGARYEGRDFELYPTAVWTGQVVSPVGARSTDDQDGTRVFLFNPGSSAVVVDVATSAGAAGTINLAPRGQGSFRMPRDEGARFTSRGGEPIYALQAITTEGSSSTDQTSAYDWGFSLIPVNAATTSVIVPYAPGSAGLTNNYSPVWVTTFASTTLYVDRDGDRSTGANVDPFGDRYDFSCAVTGLRSYTIYDDGTTSCYRPRDNSASGGDRDMTGARIYTVDQTRLVAAWGQRSSYVAGSPGLDVGTTILPFPSITMAKSSLLVGDRDGDGQADPGDTVAYTITMTNLGIIDVGAVLLTDEVPDHSAYLPGSTTLDGAPQADDGAPHSLSPLDADSPAGGLAVGTIAAGATRTAVFRVVVDDPLPFGVGSLLNLATLTTALGNASAANLLPLDAGLRIEKAADPGPVDPGDTIEYTLQVFNGTPGPQTGVAVSDALPAGVTFVPGSAVGDLSGTPVTVGVPPALVSGLTMPRGALLTITFRATVDDPLPPGTRELVNTASVSSDQHPGPASDDAVTEVARAPEPVVTKTPSPATLPEPGGTVTFGVTVGNPGAVDIILTSLSDDVFGDLLDPSNPAVADNTCPAQGTTIPAGGTYSCSFDAGLAGNGGDPDHQDTVTATVEDGEGRTAGGTATATVSFADVLPAIAVSKSPSPLTVPEPGGIVTFHVVVENLSVEEVSLTSLGDDVFGDLLDPANPAVADNTCPAQAAALPVGGTLVCSFDAFVAGDAGDPDHTNTVTAGVVDDEGNAVSASDGAAVAFEDVLPSISVRKEPSVGSVPEPGGTVTFTVTVENLSPEPVSLTSLADDVFGDLLDPANPAVADNTCPAQPATLPVGGTLVCSFDASLAGDAGDPDHTNTVTAGVVDDEGNAAAAGDAAVVAFEDVLPLLRVTKAPSAGSVLEPGGTVTFAVTVENLSAEPVLLTSLVDDVFGDLRFPGNPAVSDNTCPSQPAALPVGGTLACSFDAYLAGDAGDPDHTNTVTAGVADDEGNAASAGDDAAVAFGDVLPAVTVAKVPSVGSVPEPGAVVTFAVMVHNASVEAVDLVLLVDDVFGDLRDPANPAVTGNTCPAQPSAIPVGSTFSCSFDAFVAGNAGDPSHVNTVMAGVFDDERNPAGGSDQAEVSFGDVSPSVDVVKVAVPGTVAEPGEVVAFTVEVHNTSVEPVTLTSLVDDVFGDLLDPANPAVAANTCPSQPAGLPVGGVFSCSFEAFVAGGFGGPDHVDTVTATAVDDEAQAATGSASATVTFADLLPVVEVTKSPSTGSVPEPGAVVSFAVTVANRSVETVALVALHDDVFGDLLDPANPAVAANTCPAQGMTLLPGEAFACSFEAFVGGGFGDPDHSNTVTAAAEDDDGNRVTGQAGATVSFADVAPAISLSKDAAPATVPEPGGVVLFSVQAVNLSVEPVTITALVDDVFGDLLDPANPAVAANTCPAQGMTLLPGEAFACSFEAFVAGDAGGPDHVNTVTAAAGDDDGNLVTARDDAVVAFGDVLPAVSLTKTVAPETLPEPGGTATFTITVANASVEEVVLVSLSDDVFGDLRDAGNPLVTASNCPAQPAAIPAGGLLACTFDAFLEGNAGGPGHRNRASVEVADDEGNRAAAHDEAAVPFADVLPSIAVVKTPSVGAVAEPGAVVAFTVEVHNTGVEPVTLTALADDVFGNLRFAGNPAVIGSTCPAQPAEIPVGGALVCSFEAFVAGDASGPEHRNRVTAAAVDDEGNTATDFDDAVVSFDDVGPTIDVSKQALPGSLPEPGGVVTFGVEVANTSVEAVTLTALADDVFGDLLDPGNPAVAANTCPAQAAEIPAGGSFSCSFEAVVAGGFGGPDHVDTVTAAVVDGEGNPASGADTARVSFSDALPAIAVTKVPLPAAVPEPGGTVTFEVTVANLSVEAVTLTALADDVFGDLLDRDNPAVAANTCPAQPAEIPVGGALACSFEAFVAGDASGPEHRNRVEAAAADDDGNGAAAGAEAVVLFTDALPSLAVEKTPAVGAVPEPGAAVAFGVEVANTSAETLTLVSLTDSVFGDLLDPENTAVAANTCPAQPAGIPVGGTLSCSFEAFVAGDAGGPDHRNTVTAVGVDDEGNPAADADAARVAFGDVLPTIEVAKRPFPGRVAEPGGMVTFRVTVRNTSVEPVTLTALGDDVFGDLLDAANPALSANTCPAPSRLIAPGEALVCSFDAFVAGHASGPDHFDTVTAAVADDEGNPATASDEARVRFDDVLPALAVTKTASPSMVDEPGGIVTFLVTMENPSVEPVTLTGLVDSAFGNLRDAGNRAVWENTCPQQPALLPAGGSLSCSFEALVEGEGGGPGHVNTVTAAATDDEGNPVSAAAAATVGFRETHAVVTGHLFVDLDGDREQGPGEPHLPGVQVRLVDGEGNRFTVTSDALGNWEAGVRAGVVSMQVVGSTVPTGYRLTTRNASQTVEVPPGSITPTTDVGYQPADGSLAGKVFYDVDGDGVQGPGEPAFHGVAVALYDGGRLIRTVVTSADGGYRFTDLPPGEFPVVVRDEAERFAGFRPTLDPDGVPDGETEVTLTAGENRTGVDFAYRGTGSVGDTIWHDADGDGVQDPSEAGIAGAGVGLIWSGFDGALGSADDVTLPRQVTGSDGTYLFTGVPPGVVAVAVDPGSIDDDLEATTPTSYTYTLGPGESYLDGDIGYRQQDELPYTGFDADRLGLLAIGLITLGLVLLLAGRRRRPAPGLRWERLG